MHSKKILIISYYWPPFGGTGVYRILKLTKYLAKMGWEPIILTPQKANTDVIDDNLLKEIHPKIKVYKTKIWEPSSSKKNEKNPLNSGMIFQQNPKNLNEKIIRWIRLNIFIPDAKIGWYPYAVAEGKKIIKQEKPALIFSTSPPPTVNLIAGKLSKWANIPWVADFRDPWTKIFYLDGVKKIQLSDQLNHKFERHTLQNASHVTVVAEGFFPHLPDFKNKTSVIINGFDREEISTEKTSTEKNKKFTIRYFGTYKVNQFSENFIETLKIIKENPSTKNLINIQFYGFTDSLIKQKFEQSNLLDMVEFMPYISRSEVIPLIQKSDLVFLFIGESKINKTGISTKIFEYLLCNKHILAFGPTDGAASKIISETESGKMFDYKDIEKPAEFIFSHFEQWKNNISKSPLNQEKINNYDFKTLTEKLIDIFEQVLTEKNH